MTGCDGILIESQNGSDVLELVDVILKFSGRLGAPEHRKEFELFAATLDGPDTPGVVPSNPTAGKSAAQVVIAAICPGKTSFLSGR